MGDQKTRLAPAGSRAPDSEPRPSWGGAGDISSRHGALSRKLYTYSNYKSWADRVRAAWVDAPATEDAAED